MKPARKNFVIDIFAFVCFVFLTSTGVILHFILPPGSGHSKAIWSLTRHEWGDLHFWIAVAFLGILALHLIRHWKWIVLLVTGKQREQSGYRAGLGLVGLLALLAIASAPLLSPVGTIEGEGQHQEEQSLHPEGKTGKEIRGSMTLQEVETLTGVPVAHLLQQLQLPADLSHQQKLKDLKETYGFEMGEVREILEAYPRKD